MYDFFIFYRPVDLFIHILTLLIKRIKSKKNFKKVFVFIYLFSILNFIKLGNFEIT
jgi:hypothetical protein